MLASTYTFLTNLGSPENSHLLFNTAPFHPPIIKLLSTVTSKAVQHLKQFTIAMTPFILLTTLLASILALVTAQSGTGTTGLPFPSPTGGAPYPYPNGTFPVGPTATASAPSFLVPRAIVPRSAPYPSTGLPGTGTGTGFAMPTGYPKRMEMRGLKRARGEEKKRAARWWW